SYFQRQSISFTYLIDAFPMEKMVALGQPSDLLADFVIAKADQTTLAWKHTNDLSALQCGRDECFGTLAHSIDASSRSNILTASHWWPCRAQE
ncbi:MAG: hypothetical protein Q9203_001987, partial [Teloschistes exilis]